MNEEIKAYLAKAGIAVSARWIAIQIRGNQDAVSRELRKLVRAGSVRFETRCEFDMEFSQRLQKFIRCRRKRNYYWI